METITSLNFLANFLAFSRKDIKAMLTKPKASTTFYAPIQATRSHIA